MHTPPDSIEARGFDRPDRKLDYGRHGKIEIIKLNDGTTGMHAILEPGWRWSVDEKPLIGNPDTCPTEHIGYCVKGELVIRMVESGEERRLTRGDFFDIPPGHDAWVPGKETCELIMFAMPAEEEEEELEPEFSPESEVLPGPPH